MPAKSKQEFLNYARREASKSRSRPQYAPDDYEGTSSTGSDVWGAVSSYDGSIESEYGSSQTEQSTDFGVAEREQSFNGSQSADYQRYSGGEPEWDTSGDGAFDSSGSIDIPIRNVGGDSYDIAESVPTRTTKRVSPVDKVFGNIFGRQKAPPQPKAISVTRKLLTLAEVAKYRPGLIKLIMFSSDHMDDGISAITKGHRPVVIWSNIELPDAEILADSFLDAGQKSAYVAEKVRWVIEWEKKVQAGIILAPRVYKTIVYTVVTGLSFQL